MSFTPAVYVPCGSRTSGCSMQPQPSLNLIPTIQQAITSLLTVYEPEFLRFGTAMFMAFAAMVISWQGIRMMFGRGGWATACSTSRSSCCSSRSGRHRDVGRSSSPELPRCSRCCRPTTSSSLVHACLKRPGFLGDLISWEDGVEGTSKSVFTGGA